jgi:uncharacterized protein (DUF4415 family)
MKRRTRVGRGGKISSLKATAEAEGHRFTYDYGRWRQREEELRQWRRVPKKRVTLNLDADVLAWFREAGRGYQWKINRALRKVMEEEQKVPE